jgi:HicA toxin of bacterial toxin-antitoxin,
MYSKHQRLWDAIFTDPVRADVRWSDIESLLRALGAEISEGRGSRVRVRLADNEAVFHRPHPKPHTDKGAPKSVRRFLSQGQS